MEELKHTTLKIYRCKLCGRKLKKFSETGYGKVCYKKLHKENYRKLPLFSV